MLTHLQRPLTGRYRAEVFGGGLDAIPAGTGDEGGQPHRLIGPSTVLAVAFLLSAALVALATVALR